MMLCREKKMSFIFSDFPGKSYSEIGKKTDDSFGSKVDGLNDRGCVLGSSPLVSSVLFTVSRGDRVRAALSFLIRFIVR